MRPWDSRGLLPVKCTESREALRVEMHGRSTGELHTCALPGLPPASICPAPPRVEGNRWRFTVASRLRVPPYQLRSCPEIGGFGLLSSRADPSQGPQRTRMSVATGWSLSSLAPLPRSRPQVFRGPKRAETAFGLRRAPRALTHLPLRRTAHRETRGRVSTSALHVQPEGCRVHARSRTRRLNPGAGGMGH